MHWSRHAQHRPLRERAYDSRSLPDESPACARRPPRDESLFGSAQRSERPGARLVSERQAREIVRRSRGLQSLVRGRKGLLGLLFLPLRRGLLQQGSDRLGRRGGLWFGGRLGSHAPNHKGRDGEGPRDLSEKSKEATRGKGREPGRCRSCEVFLGPLGYRRLR